MIHTSINLNKTIPATPTTIDKKHGLRKTKKHCRNRKQKTLVTAFASVLTTTSKVNFCR